MSEEATKGSDSKSYWLESKKNVDLLFWVLVGVCAVLAAIDLFLHRHAHFSFEGIPAFYGVFGFVAFFLVVIAGKYLRRVLMREEGYYDD